MRTVTFSAIKGGVGKSSLSILTANYLMSAGYRVLVVDFDIQNSVSFYYLQDPEAADKRNLARALTDGDLRGNITQTELFVDLIPASFNLVKLRAIPEKTFSRIIPQVSGEYDFLVIDTPPTFDNLVLNAVVASTLVVTPVYLTQFDWKSAVFYRDQIELETGDVEKWRVLLNRYREPRTENPETELNQYIELFQTEFADRLLRTRIPETAVIQKAVDTHTAVTRAKTKERLFTAIASLCEEIVEHTGGSSDDTKTTPVERF